MSYILEALRKAERERNAGQVPDLQVAPRSEPSLSKLPLTRQWLTFGAVLFVGLCIGLALWLRPARTPEAAPQAVAATATSSAIEPAAPAPVAEAVAQEPEPGTARLDDLLDKSGADALPLEQQQQLSAAVPPHTPAVKPVEPAAAVEIPPASAPAAHPTQAELATAEPELPPELKKLKEMSADYRSSFPPIRVDVHAYDEQPAKRFVMINGRRYREGEVLAEGPRIVSIEEDGIVFNYRDVEVLYPIAR